MGEVGAEVAAPVVSPVKRVVGDFAGDVEFHLRRWFSLFDGNLNGVTGLAVDFRAKALVDADDVAGGAVGVF